jgi:hypothetical protein
LHIVGQKPSDTHWRNIDVQTASQLVALPVSVRLVSASDTHDVAVGQLAPSHVSGGSVTPLPQNGEQLLSLRALQLLGLGFGQQLSLFTHPVIVPGPASPPPALTHCRWHIVPLSVRSVHPTFGHDDGQFPSHSSPDSTTPLPHTGAQSRSVNELQPEAGQQPSLSMLLHVVTVPESTHWRWQPVPCSDRAVQPMFGHVVGQFPSQISPDSMTPLPQTGEQLLSFSELQLLGLGLGQQLSLLVHVVCKPLFWQAA